MVEPFREVAWRLHNKADMQGKADSWQLPRSRRETRKCRKALAHLFVAGAVLQPVAGRVEDLSRSMLGESTSRAVQSGLQLQALQGRASLAQSRSG